MAQILKTDDSRIDIKPKNGSDFSFEELNKIVDGYIEIVHLHDGNIMVIDEEGKNKMKPINKNATIVYQMGRRTTDVIVGDALICNSKQVR